MGKTKRSDGELSRERQLKHENQALKREVSRLSKKLARLDLDPYDSVKEAVEEHYHEDSSAQGGLLDKMKQKWACKSPNCSGYLEIFLYNKVGSTYYYRICSNAPGCKNRTKAQKYTQSVDGLMREKADEKV